MLTLSDPSLPSSQAITSPGALSSQISGDAVFPSLTSSISYGTGLEIDATATATIPSYSGTSIDLTVPSTINEPIIIAIDGENYTSTTDLEGTPSAGEFSYDADTTTATVELISGASPVVGTSAQIIGLSDTYTSVLTDRAGRTNQSFLTTWNLSGQLTINRSFEANPSGSCQFYAARNQKNTIKSTLRNGTQLTLWGVGFSTDNLTITDPITSDHIIVDVDLIGLHESALDERVIYRSDESVRAVSMDTLARRAGTTYRGADIQVPIPADTPLKGTTTLGDELSRSRSVGGFPYFSDPDDVRIKKWGETKLHTLSQADLLNNGDNPITISYGGSGNVWKGCQLSDEYENRELRLDEVDTGDDGDANGRRNVRITLFSGNKIITSTQLQLDGSEPNNSFDLGGKTINQTRTTYLNGEVEFQDIQEFGYAYAASQVHSIRTLTIGGNTVYQPVYSDSLMDGRFMLVRRTTTRIVKDTDDYLIKRIVKIRELQRYRSDSGKESLNIKAAIAAGQDIATNNAILDGYENFFWTERTDTTEFTLAEFKDYYPDIDVEQIGRSPKFCTIENRRDLFINKQPGIGVSRFLPDNDGSTSVSSVSIQSGDRVSGSDFRDKVETNIIYPQQGQSSYNSELDKFVVDRRTGNVRGAGLEQSLNINTEEERSGRPNEHQRIEEFAEDGEVTGNSIPESNSTRYLNTPNNGVDPLTDPSDGTIQFTGADTWEKAELAARTDISILNTQSVEVWSGVRVLPNRNYDEGDQIQFQGKRFILLSISSTYNIEGPGEIGLPFHEMIWGRFIEPVVTATEVS